MVDVRKPATLRGFHVSVADIGDQMHLCHPVLSFENDDALYLAHRLNWRDDPDALAATDPDEASQGTLLPTTCSLPIASGQGVVAAGVVFVQAVEWTGLQLEPEIAFARVIEEQPCWIGLATPAVYTALRTRLTEDARDAFDKALGDAVGDERCLANEGNAALLLLRRCGPTRRDDLAIRQLAGARQNQEFDLYRRLLIRFALELNTQEKVLDERAMRHLALVAPAKGPRRDLENAASGPKIRRVQSKNDRMSKPQDVTSRRMTGEGAKRKEAEGLATHRKSHRGQSPRYNRDTDG